MGVVKYKTQYKLLYAVIIPLSNTPSVPYYKQKQPIFLSQIISKKDQLLSYLIMFF